MPAKHAPTPTLTVTDEGIRAWLESQQEARKLRTFEIVRLFDVSRRQLQWWDEKGVLQPEHEGHTRLYTIEDAVMVGVLTDLRNRGATLQHIRRVLRVLSHGIRKRCFQYPDYALVFPRAVHFVDEPEEICKRLADTAQARSFLVPLNRITRKLFERLN